MCTNYTYLNKACPKNPYPLPNIKRLVDGASGCDLLSFMDAYSDYNQIKMHPQDEASSLEKLILEKLEILTEGSQ
ncbi:hypothetical protein CR513_41357, partial [Mucuna pruriens]